MGPGGVPAAYPTWSSSWERLAYDGHLKSHDGGIVGPMGREGPAGLGKQQHSAPVQVIRTGAPLGRCLLMSKQISLAQGLTGSGAAHSGQKRDTTAPSPQQKGAQMSLQQQQTLWGKETIPKPSGDLML